MTMDTLSPKGASEEPRRGRPRDTDADEKILSAARELLAEGGFDAMSFEAIAKRAGVTRPTIYRRWATKAHLASEISHGGEGTIPDVIEAVGLRGQLLLFVNQMLAQYSRPEMSAAISGMMVAYRRSPELRTELHDPLEKRNREVIATIIDKGKAANLVLPSVNVDTLFDIAVGAVLFRNVFSSLSVTANCAEDICNIILNGIAVRQEE